MTHLMPPTRKAASVWFTQGFSSQRDLILALKQSSLHPQVNTIASHRQARDEILSVADQAILEPLTEYPQFVLQQALAQQVSVVLVAHRNARYEQHRAAFEQQGIVLLTGTRGESAHALLDDKFAFTQRCQATGIPVVAAQRVTNADELQAAIAQLEPQHRVCVKPVTGVFAQGFWQLDRDIDYFYSLLNPSEYKANTQQFIDAYARQVEPLAYLVMPFMAGDECSVDMFCVRGQVVAQVTRIKKLHWQDVLPLGPCDDMARQLAQCFELDGIVNAQFRQDDVTGQWYTLEVNTRPSGGIGITLPSGINLAAECVAYHTGLDLQRSIPVTARVRAVGQAVVVEPDVYGAGAVEAML